MAKIRIISRKSERFADRQEAGQLLGRELSYLKVESPVVLGIPRGGVLIARELANTLNADLDVVLARKLRTPGHSELAMGSVAEGGKVFINNLVVRELGISQTQIEYEKERELAEITRRSKLIRNVWPKVPLTGRVVIITDDGVATGATMQVATWSIRQESPAGLVIALPVASEEAVDRLFEDADELVCLREPPDFGAVGQFYEQFTEIDDEDVLEILTEERNRKQRQTAI